MQDKMKDPQEESYAMWLDFLSQYTYDRARKEVVGALEATRKGTLAFYALPEAAEDLRALDISILTHMFSTPLEDIPRLLASEAHFREEYVAAKVNHPMISIPSDIKELCRLILTWRLAQGSYASL